MSIGTSHTKCSKCQSKAVRNWARPGRTVRYRTLAALPIPSDFPIPTCQRCFAEQPTPETRAALAPVLQEAYLQDLRQRARVGIDVVTKFISQRQLELLLGLSQGYLSRLRAGAGSPSAELVSHLALIANDPRTRLLELERFWALPLNG